MTPPSILIVEADASAAAGLAEMLVEAGCTIAGTASTAEEAMQRTRAWRPALVLMDVQLADREDRTATMGMIVHECDVPVVFLAAQADPATIQRAAQAEASAVLLKPCDARELRVQLDLALCRHVAERRLRESQQTLKLVLQSANVGLWDWELGTERVVFSREWKSQLGYAEDEIADHFSEWERRVHPDDLAPALDRVRRFLAEPWPDYETEFRLRHKDGSWRWILARGGLVHGSAGQAQRMLGIHIDITERKEDEKVLHHSREELEHRVAERTAELTRANELLHSQGAERRRLEAEVVRIGDEEKQRMAADLHDGICQELVGIGFKTTALRSDLEKAGDPQAARAGQIEDALLAAARHVRFVARGLQPVVAEGRGLMHALEELAAETARQRRIRCAFECPEPVLIENPDTANEIYRIAQEAILNAVTHGRATQVDVSLGEEDGEVRLTVRDDGCGLPPEIAIAPGMGLRLMKYRAGLIHGRCSVRALASAGTEVTCCVPKLPP